MTLPVNERLKTLIAEAGMTIEAIAIELAVNTRTVERWIGEGRIPYPHHRSHLAALLDNDERYIWPDTTKSDSQRSASARSEIVTVYPRRALIPTSLWIHLVESATQHVDILAQAALFLPE